MKNTLDCMPCFVEHAVHVSRMVTKDESVQREIVNRVIRELVHIDMNETPPQMARRIHGIIRELSGVKDPYLSVKDESTALALKLKPDLEEEIRKSADPFDTIVRLVIAGNIIDFGADLHFKLDMAHERIKEALNAPLDKSAVALLKAKMEAASNILYIADNCGEAVFDRFLIEPFRNKLTLAVRGFPILNDITPREVSMSGLENLVKVIDTGDSTPGVVLKHAKPEFVKAFNDADLIIAKGQGNFETMSDTDRPVIFLFRVKCKVVCNLFGNLPMGSLRIIPVNIL